MKKLTLNVKCFFLFFFIVLSLCIYAIINIIKLNQKAVVTNSVPITNKVIIIDAGHGKPDERCYSALMGLLSKR